MMETLARPLARPAGQLASRVPAAPRPVSWPWLRSRYFLLVLFSLGLPFICLAGRPLYGDVWWVLANARALVQQGSLLTADPLSFAPHTPSYVDAQWLAQLTYYGAYQLLGLAGVSTLNGVTVMLAFAILLHLGWQRTGQVWAPCAAGLVGVFIAMPFMHPRAQTLSLVVFAAAAWLLAAQRLSLPRLLALGAVEAAWANMHGSFFLGPLLTLTLAAGEVIEAVADRRWRSLLRSPRVHFLAAAFTVQLVGSLLNPYGADLYAYAVRMSGDPMLRKYVTEWAPTSAGDWLEAGFFVAAALEVAVVAVARRRLMGDLLVLGLFAVLALGAVRNVPWWALISPPFLAPYLAQVQLPAWLARAGRACVPRRENVRTNLVRAGVLGLVAVSALPWSRAGNPLLGVEQRTHVDNIYPVNAVEFLRSHDFGSRIFEQQPWGAYLDWALWPKYQPMVDSAIEVHPKEVWLDVLALNQGRASWEQLLDRYDVDVLLLSKEDQQPLIEAASRSPRWQRVYDDEMAEIYIRAGTAAELTPTSVDLRGSWSRG
jgi:hypothetical protein